MTTRNNHVGAARQAVSASLAVLISCVAAMSPAVEAGKRKVVVAAGHDIMLAPMQEIFRLRHKFAATGADGISFHLWGRFGSGSNERLDAKDDRPLREADFGDARRMLPAITSSPGLGESVLRMGLTMKKRIDWNDDVRWRRLCDNAAVIARIAKDGGIKGFAIDEEDYNKTKQFFRIDGDAPYTELKEKARERGRQFFSAVFREFPDARVNSSWLYSTILKWPRWVNPERGDDQRAALESLGELWPCFMNGFIDVMPPGAMLAEGNEERGYHGVAANRDFEVAAWETSRGILPQVAPENRGKFLAQLSVSFGSYLDMYVNPPEEKEYYHPPLHGSRGARFYDNISRMLAVADDFIWLYGEKGTWIDWETSPARSKAYGYPTWEKQIPGFSRLIRLAKGDLSPIEAEIESGAFSNVVVNGACDGGRMPDGMGTWTHEKNPPPDLFTVNPGVGAAAPGCLQFGGSGCFFYELKDLTPGDEVCVKAAMKGCDPTIAVSWYSGKRGLDVRAPQSNVCPEGWDHGKWHTVFSHHVVPEGADTLKVIFYGRASAGSPNYFDDIRIYRRPKCGEAKPTWERPNTTRRYLQGPCSERLVTFWREGKIVVGEIEHRGDWRLHYSHQPAWGAWLVRGDGTALDFRAAQLEASADGSPDHAQTWHENGLDVRLAACAPFGRRPTAFARINFENRSARPVAREFVVLLRNGLEYEMTFGTPDVYASYDPKVSDWLGMSFSRWWKEKDQNLFCTGDRLASFSGDGIAFELDKELGGARFRLSLKPGESKKVDFTLATGELPAETYDGACAAMKASWGDALRGLVMPHLVKGDCWMGTLVRSLAVQMLQMLAMPTDGDFVIARQGGQQRLMWPAEAMEMFDALDRLGLGSHVDRCCEFLFDHCVQESGEAGPFRNQWACDTACVLRALSRHCVQTGNAALWRKYAGKAAASFSWICAKREADGLFPPMKSTDSVEAPMKHWGHTDIMNLAGLEWYAKAAAMFGDSNAAAAKSVAKDYRAAIERVLDRWRAASAGKDELFLPITADGSREAELTAQGFFYLHPSAFADMGFLTADEMLRVRRWLLNHDFANDKGLYMRHPSSIKGLGRHIWYTTWCERQWATAWARAGRGDLARQALDAMLKFAVTDEFVVGERYHDADPWYYPWSPNASGSARIVQALFDVCGQELP